MIGRLVTGKGTVAFGQIMCLVFDLVSHARSQGMRLKKLRRSKTKISHSAYIALLDKDDREWLIRVSDHYRPHDIDHAYPHFDYISRDGRSGFASACGTVSLMAAGKYPWHDPDQEAAEVAARKTRFGL